MLLCPYYYETELVGLEIGIDNAECTCEYKGVAELLDKLQCCETSTDSVKCQ